MKEKIYMFLLRYVKKKDLKDDDNIFDLELVNSLFSMQLVMFLENEFGITVDNEDLDLDNFKSVNSIVLYINKKLNG